MEIPGGAAFDVTLSAARATFTAQSGPPLSGMIRGLQRRVEPMRSDSSDHGRDWGDEMGLNSVTSQEVFVIPAVHAAVEMKKNR